MERIKLVKTKFIPKDLEQGILYVSLEYGTACHLCPCGCGNKVVTPIGPTDWSFKEKKGEPSLYPSIGNWQFPCRSHYWIEGGHIIWSYQWTEEQILTGRQIEEKQRVEYYEKINQKERKFFFIQSILDRLSETYQRFLKHIK